MSSLAASAASSPQQIALAASFSHQITASTAFSSQQSAASASSPELDAACNWRSFFTEAAAGLNEFPDQVRLLMAKTLNDNFISAKASHLSIFHSQPDLLRSFKWPAAPAYVFEQHVFKVLQQHRLLPQVPDHSNIGTTPPLSLRVKSTRARLGPRLPEDRQLLPIVMDEKLRDDPKLFASGERVSKDGGKTSRGGAIQRSPERNAVLKYIKDLHKSYQSE